MFNISNSSLKPFIKNNDNIIWYNKGFFLDPIFFNNKKSLQYWYEEDLEFFNFLKVIQSDDHYYQLLKTCVNIEITNDLILNTSFIATLPFEYFLLSVPRALNFLIVNNNLLSSNLDNIKKWQEIVNLLPIIKENIKHKYILRDSFPKIWSKFDKNSCLFLINLKNFGNFLTNLEYNLGINALDDLRTRNHDVLISLNTYANLDPFKDWNINELESEIIVTNYEND